MLKSRLSKILSLEANSHDFDLYQLQPVTSAGCYKAACASTERAWIGLRGRPGVVSGGRVSSAEALTVSYSKP